MEEIHHHLVDSPASLCDYNRPVDDVDSVLLFAERHIDVLVDDTRDHSAYHYEPNVDANTGHQFDRALNMRDELSCLSPFPVGTTNALLPLVEVLY